MSKLLNVFILFLALFNLSISADTPPTTYNDLTCGEENSPEDPEDCTKYGTGSGMVCCWISDVAKTKGKCRLVPDDTARDQGIAGEKTFGSTVAADKRYWDCGNKSNYIYFNLAIILMFLFLL